MKSVRAALEEMQIARMVDEAGKIGVLVIDPLLQEMAPVAQFSRQGMHP